MISGILRTILNKLILHQTMITSPRSSKMITTRKLLILRFLMLDLRRRVPRVRVQEVAILLTQPRSSPDRNPVKLEIKITHLIWRVIKPSYWTTSQMLKSRGLKAELITKMMLVRKDTSRLTRSSWMKRMACSSSEAGPISLSFREKM